MCVFSELGYTKNQKYSGTFFMLIFTLEQIPHKQKLKTVKNEDDLLMCQLYYFPTTLKEVI